MRLLRPRCWTRERGRGREQRRAQGSAGLCPAHTLKTEAEKQRRPLQGARHLVPGHVTRPTSGARSPPHERRTSEPHLRARCRGVRGRKAIDLSRALLDAAHGPEGGRPSPAPSPGLRDARQFPEAFKKSVPLCSLCSSVPSCGRNYTRPTKRDGEPGSRMQGGSWWEEKHDSTATDSTV